MTVAVCSACVILNECLGHQTCLLFTILIVKTVSVQLFWRPMTSQFSMQSVGSSQSKEPAKLSTIRNISAHFVVTWMTANRYLLKGLILLCLSDFLACGPCGHVCYVSFRSPPSALSQLIRQWPCLLCLLQKSSFCFESTDQTICYCNKKLDKTQAMTVQLCWSCTVCIPSTWFLISAAVVALNLEVCESGTDAWERLMAAQPLF